MAQSSTIMSRIDLSYVELLVFHLRRWASDIYTFHSHCLVSVAAKKYEPRATLALGQSIYLSKPDKQFLWKLATGISQLNEEVKRISSLRMIGR
jgi:hypothetical protein